MNEKENQDGALFQGMSTEQKLRAQEARNGKLQNELAVLRSDHKALEQELEKVRQKCDEYQSKYYAEGNRCKEILRCVTAQATFIASELNER